MTEAEWLSCTDPKTMLRFVSSKAGNRKPRLFACACCRLIWPTLTDERSREAVEAREGYEDGQVAESEMDMAKEAARTARHELRYPLRAVVDAESIPEAAPAWAAGAASNTANGNYHPVVYLAARAAACLSQTPYPDAVAAETRAFCPILRCIFGNPFHPVAVHPTWLTSTAVSIAQQMYNSRDFSAIPILADAIQDAGCDNEDILNHCREPGEHVRGCWVVDLLLGKE